MYKFDRSLNLNIDDIPERCKMKGTAVKNLKTYVTAKLGDAFFNEAATEVGLANKGLILSSKWYDLSSFIQLQQLATKALKLSDYEFGVDSTRYILEVDMNGVYKFFIRVGGPTAVMNKSPQMTNAYLNFIELKILENAKGYLKAQFTLPHMLTEWYCASTEGGAIGILNVCKQPLKKFNVLEKDVFTNEDKKLGRLTYEFLY